MFLVGQHKKYPGPIWYDLISKPTNFDYNFTISSLQSMLHLRSLSATAIFPTSWFHVYTLNAFESDYRKFDFLMFNLQFKNKQVSNAESSVASIRVIAAGFASRLSC